MAATGIDFDVFAAQCEAARERTLWALVLACTETGSMLVCP
jgi:hypothetical protein